MDTLGSTRGRSADANGVGRSASHCPSSGIGGNSRTEHGTTPAISSIHRVLLALSAPAPSPTRRTIRWAANALARSDNDETHGPSIDRVSTATPQRRRIVLRHTLRLMSLTGRNSSLAGLPFPSAAWTITSGRPSLALLH